MINTNKIIGNILGDICSKNKKGTKEYKASFHDKKTKPLNAIQFDTYEDAVNFVKTHEKDLKGKVSYVVIRKLRNLKKGVDVNAYPNGALIYI